MDGSLYQRKAGNSGWRQLAVILFACTLLVPSLALADDNDLPKNRPAVSVPPPPPPPKENPPLLDCSGPNRDLRCGPRLENRPSPYYRRPVIINSTPATPPVEISALKDDWEGCRGAKLNAIQSRNRGNLDQANQLDEWLWKNCRRYSEELRDLEQM
ncbi:MAG: hypothetical protein JWM78_3190 [Verrucomicrobiaceae bacterium]|nr:hypothetical protein [Verrucomicrobiaceae bacterium]